VEIAAILYEVIRRVDQRTVMTSITRLDINTFRTKHVRLVRSWI
jgi:hypothetical protein